MNIRMERYRSGATFLARIIYRNGRRVAVIDQTSRWRAVARHMRVCGHRDSWIAASLRKPRCVLDQLLDPSWRF
jgi:hypothetical protein